MSKLATRILLLSAALAALGVLASTAAATHNAAPKGAPYVLFDIGHAKLIPSLAEIPASEDAAAAYINNSLGGLNGHPIKIIHCDTGLDSGAVVACANQAVQAKPIAVIGLDSLFGANGLPIILQAGIPMFMYPTSTQEGATSWNVGLYGGSTAEYPALGKYLTLVKKQSNFVFLTGENPGNHVGGASFVQGVGSKGTVHQIYYPLTSPDLTPAVNQALQFKPDAILAAVSGTGAVVLYQALYKAGYPMNQVYSPGAAIDGPFTFSTAGASVEGVNFMSEFNPWSDLKDPQIKAYRTAVKKYGGSTDYGTGGYSHFAFSTVMTVYNALKQIKNPNPAKLHAFFQNTTGKGFPIFMGNVVIPLKNANPATPGIRQPLIRILQWKNGALNSVTKGYISFKG